MDDAGGAPGASRSLVELLPPPDAGRLAVHATGTDVDRRELAERVARSAAELAASGVAPGQPVAVCLPNGADVVAWLFAVWAAGAVYVPVNPRLTLAERARVLDATRPAVLVTTGAPLEPLPDPVTHPSRVALVQFTSGTTGRPKAVPLTHTGVLTLLDGVIGTLRGGAANPASAEPMPNLVPVSLSLWAGIYQVLFAMRVGAAVIIPDELSTVGLAEAIERFGIRSTVLPPAMMTMLADDERIASLAPLRYVRSITAPLSPLQARRFHDRFGVAILNCYGQTELGGEVVGWSAADWKSFGDSKLGAVGRPHAGVEIRAVDTAGTPLGTDRVGELCVRTPATRAGVDTELAERLDAEGWFRTGDVGRVDAEGFVWIEGRVSEMINRGGLKVFPAEVAEVLALHPAVRDAAVVGIPDPRLGEVPFAFVVLAEGATMPPAGELDQLCRAELAPYKVPVGFRAIDALPRNEVGKVLGAELRAAATSG